MYRWRRKTCHCRLHANSPVIDVAQLVSLAVTLVIRLVVLWSAVCLGVWLVFGWVYLWYLVRDWLSGELLLWVVNRREVVVMAHGLGKPFTTLRSDMSIMPTLPTNLITTKRRTR